MKKLIALTLLIIASQASHAMTDLTREKKELDIEIKELEARIKAKEEEIALKREARKKNVAAIENTQK